MQNEHWDLQGETHAEHFWRIGAMLGFVLLSLFMVVQFGNADTSRPLVYEKGTYLGPEDPALTEQDLGDIRYRMRSQSF